MNLKPSTLLYIQAATQAMAEIVGTGCPAKDAATEAWSYTAALWLQMPEGTRKELELADARWERGLHNPPIPQ